MKEDETYSGWHVCPTTGKHLARDEIYHNFGVCIHCGEASGCTLTHTKMVVGKWVRPSLWERLKGLKPIWVEKKDGTN